MSKDSDAPKMQVVDYYLSVHYGICSGPVDALLQVYIGEKPILGGGPAKILGGVGVRQETQYDFNVKQRQLFGGVKKEGGVSGSMHYLPGTPTQLSPSTLAGRLGRTVARMPAYRGISALFFSSGGASGGFYVGSNTPYVKPIWAAVSRVPTHWYPEKAKIAREEPTKRSIYFAVDNSGSMNFSDDGGATTRMQVTKAALSTVLDRIKIAVDQGFVIDIGFNFWSTYSQTFKRYTVTAANIDEIKAWVNSRSPYGGTDFNQAVTDATSWWSAIAGQAYSKRAMIFITDGEPTPTSTATTAAATVDGAAWAGVDVYGINVNLTDTTYTAMLDNTSTDGVPVVSGSDPSGLVLAVDKALFPDDIAPDANPAHIIHECLTNGDWGMGAPLASLDDAAFRAAADTFFAERFGLTMMWSQQTTIEAFVTEVLDHVEATLYVNPATGLLTLDPVRADYDEATLPILDDTNSTITNFQRRALAETINQITITSTSYESEEEESVTIHDLANIAMQGAVVGNNRNYYGVRMRFLANLLAARDLRTASAPLASCEIEVDRLAWNFVPGGVCKIVHSEHGITQTIVMRVGKINYGRPGDPTIKMSLVEDVFSIPVAEFDEQPGSGWEDPSQPPEPLEHTLIFTQPYISGKPTDPEVYAGILGATSNVDTKTYELNGYKTDLAGNVTESLLGTKDVVGRGTLATALPAEITSTLPTPADLSSGTAPVIGGIMLIGDGTEEEVEWALITDYLAPDWTVQRGALDTVPKAWPIGTPVWFFATTTRAGDTNVRAEFETVDYQMLTNTSMGQLSEDDAPWVSEVLSDRPHLPTRPANVKVDGDAWGPVDAQALASVTVTWATRNRLTEDSVILAWDAASLAVEDGQTTSIIATQVDGTPVITYTGETGTSRVINTVDFGAAEAVLLKVVAVRDTLQSLQGHTIKIVLAPAPVNSVLPTITGSNTVGQLLTGDPGTWDKGVLTYQWFRHAAADGLNGIEIVGATEATYTSTIDDDGMWLTFAVTSTSDAGSTTATSLPFGAIGAELPFNITPPEIYIVS